jgi:ribosomal protein S4E
MKKIILFLGLLFSGFVLASNGLQMQSNNPKVGDVLIINEPTGQAYDHIKFPKLNIIIKRGGLANYKSVYGETVIVKNVMTKKDGKVFVQVESQNGKKFFGFLKTVNADYNKAIASGEMSIL